MGAYHEGVASYVKDDIEVLSSRLRSSGSFFSWRCRGTMLWTIIPEAKKSSDIAFFSLCTDVLLARRI